MIIFIIIVILLLVIGIVFWLYRLIKEETTILKEEKQIKEQEEKKKPQNQLKSMLKEKSFEQLLEEAKGNMEKLTLLKETTKNDLKDAMRQKNMELIKECNKKLKILDITENNLKGN